MPTPHKPPISPHLQIYRLPLTALISITHRMTGIVLSVGALLLVAILSAAADGPDAYAYIHAHIASWYGLLLLIGLTFGLFFHVCNGVRHLFWDGGFGFELKTADLTAKMVLVGAFVLTVITWLIVFIARS